MRCSLDMHPLTILATAAVVVEHGAMVPECRLIADLLWQRESEPVTAGSPDMNRKPKSEGLIGMGFESSQRLSLGRKALKSTGVLF